MNRMAEKENKHSAEFAKDKNAFSGGTSTKGEPVAKKAKQKQSGSHQPRDANYTSGHDVQKSAHEPDGNSVQDNHDSFQNNTGKAAGRKAKPRQKKRRQSGQFRKENSFTENKEKPDSDNAGSKAQDDFSKEQNTFTEDSGGEQTEETKDFKDDYRRRDTYHQSEKREDTAGVSIRTGNVRKTLILNVISRRGRMLLQKAIPLPGAQNRNFRAAGN